MNWNQLAIWGRNLLTLLLAPIILFTGASASVTKLAGDEAITATRHSYRYGSDRLLLGAYNCWLLDNYGILAPLAAQAGLNFLISNVNDTFMDQCGAAGIGVIAAGYNAPSAYWDIKDGTQAAWLAMSTGAYKNHPALWGDDLIDEPTSAEFGKINGILEHYYSLNTRRIPLVNLFPVYANSQQLGNEPDVGNLKTLLPWTTYSDEQLDRYRRHVADYIRTIDTDYISVDIYPYNVDGTRDDWLHNLDILGQAARDTGRDLWVITQAAGNMVDGGEGNFSKRWCDTLPDQRQQNYASLAFGAKAIIYACFQTGWWDDGSHMVTAAGDTTDTFDAVKAVNGELRAFAEKYGEYRWLGAYTVNDCKVAGLRYGLSNGLPKKEQLCLASRDGLLVGCFAAKQGGGRAYVIVNMMELLDEKTATLAVDLPKGKALTVYGGGNVASYTHGFKLELALRPGDGVFITVE